MYVSVIVTASYQGVHGACQPYMGSASNAARCRHITVSLPTVCLQVIGVGASVIGDMSSRPNWGLNELDFVFATLVVSSSRC